MNRFKRSIYAHAIYAPIALFSVAVGAQEDGAKSIEEVVVTGQKFDRSIQDTPTSVNVVTGDSLRQQNLLDFNDVLSSVPNVTMEPGTGSFQIRGINALGVSGGGNSYLASMYVDGAPLPPNMIDADLSTWDLQQVEILRGPQSTLQGRNALAGAIVVKTAEPTPEWDAKLRGIVGEYGRQDFAFAGGGGMLNDQLSFRVTAENRQHDGFNTNRFLNEPSDPTEDRTYRLKVLFEPSANPDLSFGFSYTRNNNRSGIDFVQNVNSQFEHNRDVAVPPHRTINQDKASFSTNKNDIYKFEFEYQLNDAWTLTSDTNFSTNEFYRENDGDLTPEPRVENFSDNKTDTLSQELRVTFDYDNIKGVAGLYYSDVEIDNLFYGNTSLTQEAIGARDNVIALLTTRFGVSAATAGFLADQSLALYDHVFPVLISIDTTINRSVVNKALFADATYTVNDRFEIFGGFRFDRETQDNENINNYAVGGRDQFPNPADFSFDPTLALLISGINGIFDAQAAAASQDEPLTDASFSEFLPKIGMTYQLNDDSRINLMYQKGYRSGGVGTNIAKGTTFTYDKEFSHNYELSYRSTWLDGELTANANLFHIDWRDQQVRSQLSSNVFDVETLNASRSSIKGVELEFTYAIRDNLLVNFGYGYAKTNFEEFFINGDNPNQVTRDLSGFEFVGSSPHTVNFGALYSSGNFIASINGNYKSSSRRLDNPWANSVEQSGEDIETIFFNPSNDPRWLINARVGYQWEQLGVFLTAQNLLGKEYQTFANTRYFASDSNPGTATWGEPRELALEVTHEF